MEFWNQVFIGNTLQRWLLALGTIALLYLVLVLFRSLILLRLAEFVQRTRTGLDDVLVNMVRGTKSAFLFMLSVYFGILMLDLPLQTTAFAGIIIRVVLIVQIGLWLNALITFLISRRVKRTLVDHADDATVVSTLGVVLQGMVWGVVVLLALDNIPGIQITTLIASLGITGIAVGLAVQNILSDLFASLSIALDKPFVIGDFINVGDFSGTVEHVGLKSTRVRSISGEQLVFGNNDLLSSRIRNYKRMASRRVAFILAVTYQTSYDKLVQIPQIIRDVIESNGHECIRFDRSHLKEYGASSINFETVYLLDSADFMLYMDIHQAINLEIYRRFEEEGIDFALPAQSVYLQNGHGNGPYRPKPVPEATAE